MAVIDQNAEALRCLLDGPLLAAEIADRVGWDARVAGQKMAALERQGFVLREIFKSSAGPSSGEKVIYRWRLAARGEAIAGASSCRSAATEPEPVESADAASPATAGAAAVTVERPVPSPSGVALRLELSEWLLVLAAARHGASSGRADRAQAIRHHLGVLEDQADVKWNGQGYVPRPRG
jgi:hypothetical protein